MTTIHSPARAIPLKRGTQTKAGNMWRGARDALLLAALLKRCVHPAARRRGQ